MPNRRCDDNLYQLGVFVGGVQFLKVQYIKGGEYALFLDATQNDGIMSLQMQSPSGVWMDVLAYGLYMRTSTLTMNQVGLVLPAGAVRIYATAPVANVAAYLVGAG